jgi:hypothetical protein
VGGFIFEIYLVSPTRPIDFTYFNCILNCRPANSKYPAKPIVQIFMSQQNADVMLGVFTAHSVQSPNVEIPVEVGGKTHVIVGRSTVICDAMKPIINLLTPDCTPGRPVQSALAESDFMAAVEALVKDGREFVSALRVFWALPVIEWSLKVQPAQATRPSKIWTEIPYFQIANLALFDRGEVVMQNIPGHWEIEPGDTVQWEAGMNLSGEAVVVGVMPHNPELGYTVCKLQKRI